MAQGPRSRAETSVGEKESMYNTDLSRCVHCIPVTSRIQLSCSKLLLPHYYNSFHSDNQSDQSAEQMKDWHQMKCYVVEEQSVIGLILQIGICNHVILINFHNH